jgi:hypothetical protein
MTKNEGHKMCVDTSSPELSDDLYTKKINYCGTLGSNRKAMPMFVGKKIKLKQGDKGTKVGIT